MAKTIRISSIVLISLGAAWFGLPGCNGENLPSQRAPLRVVSGVAGSTFEGIAGASTSQVWQKQHFLCGVTSYGKPIAKNVDCSEKDPPKCFKTCGPMNLGYKELTCSGTTYAENSMCNFWPKGDFSCFRIPEPEEVHEGCPKDEALAPRHSYECAVPDCTVCGGTSKEQTTGYRNQGEGLLKPGYCICRDAIVDGAVKRVWNCATMGTAWPCPNGFGC